MNDTVDLEVLAHDALLLELPPAPLCRQDCRGLCSMCGADLNIEQCDCKPVDRLTVRRARRIRRAADPAE